MDSATERAARTQTIFRAGNEALARAGRRHARLTLICECSDERCLDRVELDRDEYATVRRHSRRFLVTPGHADASTEALAVVERHEAYWVIEKRAAAGEIADEMAFRADATEEVP